MFFFSYRPIFTTVPQVTPEHLVKYITMSQVTARRLLKSTTMPLVTAVRLLKSTTMPLSHYRASAQVNHYAYTSHYRASVAVIFPHLIGCTNLCCCRLAFFIRIYKHLLLSSCPLVLHTSLCCCHLASFNRLNKSMLLSSCLL